MCFYACRYTCHIQSTHVCRHLYAADVPVECTEGWAGRVGGGRVKVCNGGRQGGRAGVPGGSQAA